MSDGVPGDPLRGAAVLLLGYLTMQATLGAPPIALGAVATLVLLTWGIYEMAMSPAAYAVIDGIRTRIDAAAADDGGDDDA